MKIEILEELAEIAEQIWLNALPVNPSYYGTQDRLISASEYDKLYQVLTKLTVAEDGENWFKENRFDSNLIEIKNNTSIGKQKILRQDVKSVFILNGTSAIRATTHQKLMELRKLAQADLCPAWAVIETVQQIIALEKQNVVEQKIDVVATLNKVLPNWRQIRDYLKLKRNASKRLHPGIGHRKSY